MIVNSLGAQPLLPYQKINTNNLPTISFDDNSVIKDTIDYKYPIQKSYLKEGFHIIDLLQSVLPSLAVVLHYSGIMTKIYTGFNRALIDALSLFGILWDVTITKYNYVNRYDEFMRKSGSIFFNLILPDVLIPHCQRSASWFFQGFMASKWGKMLSGTLATLSLVVMDHIWNNNIVPYLIMNHGLNRVISRYYDQSNSTNTFYG